MTRKRVTALLFVVILLVSAVGGVASVVTAGSGDGIAVSHDDNDDDEGWGMSETKSADEAYVTDDGDVVLVYDYDRESADGSIPSGHAGVDVSAGLAHFEMHSNEIETDTTGDLTLWASPDEIAANGTLSTPRPDWLTDLDVDIESAQSEDTNRASMNLDAEMALEGDASALAMIQQARTSGFVDTTPTSLVSNGSAGVELPISMGADRSHNVVLTESDGSYTLSVEESYVLQSRYGEDPTEGWDSRQAARETLREEFCAGSLEEACSVSLDSYALSDGENPRLDLAYTVTYDGLDAKLSEAIVEGLTMPRMNTSEAEATELANRVENVTLSRVEASYVSSGGDTAVSWNVSLDGKDDLTLAYAGVLEAVERASLSGAPGGPEMAMFGGPFGSTPGELADQLRTQVEASRAANLQQSTRWDLSFTTDGDTAQLNGTATSETTNWASYVDELQARDGTVPPATAASLEVRTAGDRIVTDGSFTVGDEELLLGALESYNETLSRYGTETDWLTESIGAFERANFTRARMDIRVGDRVTYEGAVAVENATVLTSKLPEPYASIDGTYTSIDDRRTVVRLDDAVAADADAAAVRELAFVGENTDISLAGEWDEDFESLDVSYVENYLGLRDDASDNDDLPIIVLAGGGLALTAAAGGGIILFRGLG